MTLIIPEPWWKNDHYDIDETIPIEMEGYAGPHGVALVKLWPDGCTTKGWGARDSNGKLSFAVRYARGLFNPKMLMQGYDRDRWALSFVMRSMRLVCIDIDGKNGGIEHAEELLLGAPPTLAETSKSGKGFHLFYSVPEEWDLELGFHAISDSNGIVQGVDIRGVGCVHHHKQQRWNGREIAPLPDHILQRLKERKERQMQAMDEIKKAVVSEDSDEILLIQHNLRKELEKPISYGARNASLFGLGAKMFAARIKDWEELIRKKAAEIDLDDEETDKIVRNIAKYS